MVQPGFFKRRGNIVPVPRVHFDQSWTQEHRLLIHITRVHKHYTRLRGLSYILITYTLSLFSLKTHIFLFLSKFEIETSSFDRIHMLIAWE